MNFSIPYFIDYVTTFISSESVVDRLVNPSYLHVPQEVYAVEVAA